MEIKQPILIRLNFVILKITIIAFESIQMQLFWCMENQVAVFDQVQLWFLKIRAPKFDQIQFWYFVNNTTKSDQIQKCFYKIE